MEPELLKEIKSIVKRDKFFKFSLDAQNTIHEGIQIDIDENNLSKNNYEKFESWVYSNLKEFLASKDIIASYLNFEILSKNDLLILYGSAWFSSNDLDGYRDDSYSAKDFINDKILKILFTNKRYKYEHIDEEIHLNFTCQFDYKTKKWNLEFDKDYPSQYYDEKNESMVEFNFKRINLSDLKNEIKKNIKDLEYPGLLPDSGIEFEEKLITSSDSFINMDIKIYFEEDLLEI